MSVFRDALIGAGAIALALYGSLYIIQLMY